MNRHVLLLTALFTFTGCTDPSDADPESTSEVTQSLDAGTYRLIVPPALGGTFTVLPAGAPCGVSCWTYQSGTVVTVSPTANVGAAFQQWTGDCSGEAPCAVTMNQDHSVSAVFVPLFNLSIPQMTNGSVQWNLAIGPTRGGGPFAQRSGTIITLTAIPDPGATFTGWTGDCSGTGPCSLPMTQDHTVSATFSGTPANPTLSIVTLGPGAITASPAPTCNGALCSYPVGTMVTLTEVPAAGATFLGWSGACAGTSTSCIVVMNASLSVTGNFAMSTLPLNVFNAGGGSVTSFPAGINCGAQCSALFPANTLVNLTAVPDPNYSFVGWSGAVCGGTGTCSITMTQAQSITAVFQRNNYALQLSPTTNGTISVTPAGPSCGTGCTSYPAGTSVTITATPAAGATFTGWQGDCASAGTSPTCTLVMNGVRQAGATFAAATTHTLTITSNIGGTTRVSPSGFCGSGTCNFTFAAGTPITLTFTPNAGNQLYWYELGSVTGCEWDGLNTCTLTLDQDAHVSLYWFRDTWY